jgi:hypothetical protein
MAHIRLPEGIQATAQPAATQPAVTEKECA